MPAESPGLGHGGRMNGNVAPFGFRASRSEFLGIKTRKVIMMLPDPARRKGAKAQSSDLTMDFKRWRKEFNR